MHAKLGNGQLQIEQMLCPEAYPHPVEEIALLETHISWVILTGDFAYKIKKPVQYDFVDYSSLGARKRFCELELTLNRRFAPNLYLGVVPIVNHDGGVKILPESEHSERSESVDSPIEYAVKMRQFPQDSIVAARLQNPDLTSEAVGEFGGQLASFHESIEAALPTMDCVQPDHIVKDALDNFALVRNSLKTPGKLALVDRLEDWTLEQSTRLTERFIERLSNGKVRRCHGDLHLKNIIQLNNGALSAFDGIEFNEAFQWVDTLSEIAFPVMDFFARGRPDLGWRLLNTYLESTGEYPDLDVLRFYLVYRAMVRAKVTLLNPNNHRPDERSGEINDELSDQDSGPWDKYLSAAKYFAFDLEPKISITHGFSGSGKSTIAMKVIEQDGGIRVRSDCERHRLARKFNTCDEYSTSMSDWVYIYVLELTVAIVDAGFPVIVDATFLSYKRRQLFSQVAREIPLDFEILDCDAPFDELVKRILKRKSDPSDATVEVLKNQMETHDPLTPEERDFVKTL